MLEGFLDLFGGVWAVSEAGQRLLQRKLEALDRLAMARAVEAVDDRRDPRMAAVSTAQDAHEHPWIPLELDGSRALIKISGVLQQDVMPSSNNVTYPEIRQAVDIAAGDDFVELIVLLIDSPGGGVRGVWDLADAIFAARARKPVVAIIERHGHSAAYLLASQATEVWAHRGAELGSIGVFAVLDDDSEVASAAGWRVILVRNEHPDSIKGEGAPGVAISDAAIANAQESVNHSQQLFDDAISRGRGLPPAIVQSLADGRNHSAPRALELGLINRIGTLADLSQEDTMPNTPKPPDPAAPPAPDPPAASRGLRDLVASAVADLFSRSSGSAEASADEALVERELELAAAHQRIAELEQQGQPTKTDPQQTALAVVDGCLMKSRATPAMKKAAREPLAALWRASQGKTFDRETAIAAYEGLLKAFDGVPPLALTSTTVADETQTGNAPMVGMTQLEAEVNSRNGISEQRARELREKYASSWRVNGSCQ